MVTSNMNSIPLPKTEDITTCLQSAKLLSIPVAQNGFWHSILEYSSFRTINTPFGRHCWKCMPYRLSNGNRWLQTVPFRSRGTSLYCCICLYPPWSTHSWHYPTSVCHTVIDPYQLPVRTLEFLSVTLFNNSNWFGQSGLAVHSKIIELLILITNLAKFRTQFMST